MTHMQSIKNLFFSKSMIFLCFEGFNRRGNTLEQAHAFLSSNWTLPSPPASWRREEKPRKSVEKLVIVHPGCVHIARGERIWEPNTTTAKCKGLFQYFTSTVSTEDACPACTLEIEDRGSQA
jgi:hypothetical protein